MIAHLVRIYLGHASTVTEDDKDVFRARSRERFSKYSDEVVRMLKGRSDFFEAVSSEAIAEAYGKIIDDK